MKPEGRTDIARFPLVILGTLGIVFGDIGTSPLYALRECFLGHNSVPVTVANVYGVLSLVFWSLIIIVSVKYLLLVMRADNHGEGGILALMALVVRRTEGNTCCSFGVKKDGANGRNDSNDIHNCTFDRKHCAP